MSTQNVLSALPAEYRDDPTSDAAQAAIELRTLEAYAALFNGRGGKLDADIVLVDLAVFTRYYDTTMQTVPAEQVKAQDAARGVFQRVLEALTRANVEPVGLHTAVLMAPPHEEN